MESPVVIQFQSDMERLIRLHQAMSPLIRPRIVPLATRRVYNFIHRHFLAYAQTHHASADRLGAPHTKHMERAARDMTHESNASEGRITLAMAGVGRAYHDIDIRMRDKRLTLPIAKESYGKTVADMRRRYGDDKMFVFQSRHGNLIMAASEDKGRGRKRHRTMIPLFVLKEHVHQRQDATMLPRPQEISEVAYDALKESIAQVMGRA